MTLIRSYDNFDCQAHINSVRILDGALYVLAHNFGASALYRLDQVSGATLDTWPDFGQSSHDIVPFEDAFLTLDSFGGGLLRVHRATKQARTLWVEQSKFTKGLCVEDGIAYFGVSLPAQRDERHVVVCDVLAFDLARESVLWRRPMPLRGLINAIATPQQLAHEKVGT
jgi:hypothetical protein